MKKYFFLIVIWALMALFMSPNEGHSTPDTSSKKKKGTPESKKIGVLLVNHGSHQMSWRNMLLDVEKKVRDKILGHKKVSGLKTAFMEFSEPSIATQLKAFDNEGYDIVILVPLFLTLSSHVADDIPIIIGAKSDPKVKARMDADVEIYMPRANCIITPLLDYPDMLKKNIRRRVEALSDGKGKEGVVLVAYGDTDYTPQWEKLVTDIGKYLKAHSNITSIAYAWCGHVVDFSPDPTTKAIEKVLEIEDKVIVIPVLVAVDQMLQKNIIRRGVRKVKNRTRVLYKPDSILPDENLNQWTIDIVFETLKNL